MTPFDKEDNYATTVLKQQLNTVTKDYDHITKVTASSSREVEIERAMFVLGKRMKSLERGIFILENL